MSLSNYVGRPKKYNPEEPEIFQEAIDTYFIPDNYPWTISGLCIHLGIVKDTWYNYSKLKEFSDSCKAAQIKIENYAENKLFTQPNVTGIIFNLKNNFNWVDKQEINSNNTNTNIDNTNKEILDKLKEKYLKENE